MENTKRSARLVSRILAMVLAVIMAAGTMAITSGAAVSEEVLDAKNGVVQIQVWFVDDEAGVNLYASYGTGFLVNKNTIVTCDHVTTNFTDSFFLEWKHAIKEVYGVDRTVEQVKNLVQYRVILFRDTYVLANLKHKSAELDLSVLQLVQDINREPLAIRDSETLKQTEAVHALGFPSDLQEIDDVPYGDVSSVAVSSGTVNKVGDLNFETTDGREYKKVNCVEHSALIVGGNSGGPLVDDNGNVVGINAAGSDTRNIAVSSSQLIRILNEFNIDFDQVGDTSKPDESKPEDTSTEEPSKEPVSTPDPVEDEVDTDKLSALVKDAADYEEGDYTKESYEAFEAALEAAEEALESGDQNDVDDAYDELKDAIDGLEKAKAANDDGKKDDKLMLIIIIAGAAVVIILIIVITVVVSKKGKNKAAPAPAAPARPAAPQAPAYRAPVAPQAPARPAPVAPPVSNETTVLNNNNTTVLSQGAGETTVLSANINGGTLTRVSNGERIPINSADFSVGRERTKVDYCVGGNTSISRVHARFVVRNGVTYVVDNKAANGTYVNGIKAQPGQEIELKSGDKVVLADEKFEYNK